MSLEADQYIIPFMSYDMSYISKLCWREKSIETIVTNRSGTRKVAKFLQESILNAFDFMWKV